MKHYLLICLFCLFIVPSTSQLYGEKVESQNYLDKDSSSQSSPPPTIQKSIPYDEDFHHPLIDPNLEETDGFQSKFMHMLFLLGLLISFMLFASWMLKRMTKSRVTQLNQASSIKLLETRYLSPKSTIYLIDVKGQSLLIGESASGLTHLATLGFSSETAEDDSNYKRPSIPPYFSDHPK
jgi:flagellar protein FliO/FliZ